jgi:hypothetical protein
MIAARAAALRVPHVSRGFVGALGETADLARPLHYAASTAATFASGFNQEDQNMTRIKKLMLSFITCSALGAPLMAGGEAQARSQAAILGREMLGSQGYCFNEGSGGPRNDCSYRAQWDIPIVYDSAGWSTIYFSAVGSGSGTLNVACAAYSATYTGVVNWGGRTLSDHTIRNDGMTEWLNAAPVYANGFGGTWLSCSMDPHTTIFNVTY